MERFIPYEKLSKKKQRELDSAKRGSWSRNPVTRRAENPKAYNRRRAQKWREHSMKAPFPFRGGLIFRRGDGIV